MIILLLVVWVATIALVWICAYDTCKESTYDTDRKERIRKREEKRKEALDRLADMELNKQDEMQQIREDHRVWDYLVCNLPSQPKLSGKKLKITGSWDNFFRWYFYEVERSKWKTMFVNERAIIEHINK